MKENEITIGLDPELMLVEKNSGRIVSAIPVLRNNKYNPIDLGDGFTCYYDNVLVEGTFIPSTNKEEFIKNLKMGLSKIADKVGDKYSLAPISSHIFGDNEIEHPDAAAFGCNPEYCAYDISEVIPPEPGSGLRSGSAHIHIGRSDFKQYEDEYGDILSDDPLLSFDSKIKTIKLMDIFVGLPLAIMDTFDDSKERRKLYGKAGRHRVTKYGVEYRTPSNFWMTSPEIAELIFDLTKYAVNLEMSGRTEDILPLVSSDEVRTAIDNSDSQLAMKVLKDINFPVGFLERISNMIGSDRSKFSSNWGI